MLYYFLGSVEDARDALQESFIKCWRRREMLGGIENLRAWVFQVTLNTGRDLRSSAWRRHRRTLHQPEAEVIAQPTTNDADRCREEQLAAGAHGTKEAAFGRAGSIFAPPEWRIDLRTDFPIVETAAGHGEDEDAVGDRKIAGSNGSHVLGFSSFPRKERGNAFPRRSGVAITARKCNTLTKIQDAGASKNCVPTLLA